MYKEADHYMIFAVDLVENTATPVDFAALTPAATYTGYDYGGIEVALYDNGFLLYKEAGSVCVYGYRLSDDGTEITMLSSRGGTLYITDNEVSFTKQ